MTRSEALEYFKEELKDGKCSDTCPICNAMEWAIKALEEPTLTTAGEPMAFFGPIGIEPIWHPYPEEKPQEAGKYIIVRKGFESFYYYIAIWGKSKELDDADERLKALTSYFFEYDSEWGDCIITDVLAWMPIPQYTKEKADE